MIMYIIIITKNDYFKSRNAIITIKVFIKCRILSIEAILSAYRHTHRHTHTEAHTHTHTHTHIHTQRLPHK